MVLVRVLDLVLVLVLVRVLAGTTARLSSPLHAPQFGLDAPQLDICLGNLSPRLLELNGKQ